MRSLLASSIIAIRFFTGCRPVLLGSLSNDDGDGNENGKKAIGLDWLWSQAFLAATVETGNKKRCVPKATHVLRKKLRKD